MKLVSLSTPLLSVLIICTSILLHGCSGGNGPVFPELTVGQISGPDRPLDSTFPVYSIDIQGDAAVSCEWSVVPETAGYFADVAGHSAMFCPEPVASDTVVEIRVSVSSDYRETVTRTFDAIVCCTPTQPPGEPVVSEIMGGRTVTGNSWVTYGVEVTGGSNVTFAWSVDPESAGTITHPTSRYTNFAAVATDVERSAIIRVVISSDGCEDVIRTLLITIVPAEQHQGGLSVGDITGPGSVAEETTAPFSIVAQGDAGITYEWKVDPCNAGVFDSPDSPSVNFTASPMYDQHIQSTVVDITVEVSSANHATVVKSRKLAIINTDFTIGWVKAPTEILENDTVPYSINPDPYLYPNIDPPPFRWECHPVHAGTFIVAQGIDNEPDYYVTSVWTPEVLFRASEVQEDTPVTIAVFYDDEFIDSINVLIMNDEGKPPDSHWYEPSGIAGPTQVIEARENKFYFSVPAGEPDWAYEWSVVGVDDIVGGMPWIGEYRYPGTLEPIRDGLNEWNWRTMELIANNFDGREWLKIIVDCPGGPHELLTCVRPVLHPCLFSTEIFPARWYSYYPIGPFPPEKPLEPWFNQREFDKYDDDPQIIRKGDIIRLFAIVDSYRSDDFLQVSWETEPPGVVHFWGDQPYEQPKEIEEQWLDDKICNPYFPGSCGSHYLIPPGSMSNLVWVEMTCYTDERFDVVLTIESIRCDPSIRMMRFNE